jgi:hypothetical protein
MQGSGIAGALWSLGLQAGFFPRLRLRPAKAGVALIAALAFILCAPGQARATIITETFTGIVEGQGNLPDTAFYQARLGGPIQDLNGDNFTLTVTADDTAGQQSTQSSGSSITTLGSSNPATAVLTVGGQTFAYGTLPNSIISSTLTRTGSDSLPGGNITFSLSERSDTSRTVSSVVGDDLIGINLGLNNPPVVAGTNWEAPLSYNAASTPTGTPSGAFTFQRIEQNTTTGQTLDEQTAGGFLVATGLTVSATVVPPPPPPPPTSGFPTSTACAQDVNSNSILVPTTSNPSLSTTGARNTVIQAAFNPTVGLAKTEADCGVTGFNWQQTITATNPAPYYTCADSSCSQHTQITPGATYYDPPANGWDYCNKSPNNIWQVTPNPFGSAGCRDNNPFYINPATAGEDPSFYDSPSDPCISNPDGSPSLAWDLNYTYSNGVKVQDRCNVSSPSAGELEFTTTLVGTIVPNVYARLPYTFDWTDTFNGALDLGINGMGGILYLISTPGSEIPVDPTTGEGGITVISINGAPVSEPASLLILLIGAVYMLLLRLWEIRWRPILVGVNTSR